MANARILVDVCAQRHFAHKPDTTSFELRRLIRQVAFHDTQPKTRHDQGRIPCSTRTKHKQNIGNGGDRPIIPGDAVGRQQYIFPAKPKTNSDTAGRPSHDL